MRIGEWPEGALELGADGRVRSRDDEGATIVVGSTLEQFLAAVMAREGFLVERDGEFKDVFDEEDVDERVRDKQTRAALKIDPDAAAWHLEAAERAFDDGDEAAAEAALWRARWRSTKAPATRGRCSARCSDGRGGWRRRRRASRAPGLRRRRRRAACAPSGRRRRRARPRRRATRRRAPRHAEAARAADAGAVARWLDEARARLDDGDGDGALNRGDAGGGGGARRGGAGGACGAAARQAEDDRLTAT